MPLPYAACFSQSPAGRRSNKSSAAMPDTASGSTAWLTDWRNPSATRISRRRLGAKIMTDEQLAAMHRLLAEYHRKVVAESLLDVVQQYHADLAQRLADEAALIPRRTAIVERLHEREQQKTEDGDVDK